MPKESARSPQDYLSLFEWSVVMPFLIAAHFLKTGKILSAKQREQLKAYTRPTPSPEEKDLPPQE